MGYRVTAPYVTVQTQGLTGPVVVGLYAGALLPDDVPDATIKHLSDNGMIEKGDEVIGQPEAQALLEQPTRPEAPAKSAGKAEWVDFAVARGMARDDAEAVTKEQLVAVYG